MSTCCHYPTDVSEAQWELLQPLLPQPQWRPGGPGRKPLDLRRVVNLWGSDSPKLASLCSGVLT